MLLKIGIVRFKNKLESKLGISHFEGKGTSNGPRRASIYWLERFLYFANSEVFSSRGLDTRGLINDEGPPKVGWWIFRYEKKIQNQRSVTTSVVWKRMLMDQGIKIIITQEPKLRVGNNVNKTCQTFTSPFNNNGNDRMDFLAGVEISPVFHFPFIRIIFQSTRLDNLIVLIHQQPFWCSYKYSSRWLPECVRRIWLVEQTLKTNQGENRWWPWPICSPTTTWGFFHEWNSLTKW